jgi:Predicted membrane-bound mannosyltransferase
MSIDVARSATHPPLSASRLPRRWPVLDVLRSLVSDTTPATSRASVLELGLLGCLIACGALLRFWGLGSVGLHGDEETMGMAVRGILAEGAPILPSGMFYPRGLTQLYLMAGSVSLFGESEWALRLPSALCGVLLIFIAYFVGRRFLRVEWNLAFVAAIAALPELVVYSQTARMYIFFVTCVAAAMAFVFAWERSNRTRWLVAATATLILGMDMQVLAVSAIALFLLPGIVHGDARSPLVRCARLHRFGCRVPHDRHLGAGSISRAAARVRGGAARRTAQRAGGPRGFSCRIRSLAHRRMRSDEHRGVADRPQYRCA